MAADLARIKRNVAKMASQNAPEADIDGYIASEGVTVEDVRNFKAQPAPGMDAAGFAQHLATGEQSSNIERAKPRQPGPMDFLTQGMSGLNEGIAMGLGAPVDLATLGINAATTGVNALTGGSIPQITNPIGGSQRIREGLLAPTIQPETNDPMLQGVRRVSQEAGAWAVPGGGLAARTARPLQTAVRELPSVLGSGAGAAIAQTAMPGNPIAEFIGQMGGGLTPSALAHAARRPPAPPSVDQLRTEKNAAYNQTQNLGVAYNPQSYDNLLANIVGAARADQISPERHAAAYSFIRDMAGRRGQPVSLTELDQVRQMVRRDLITPSYGNPSAAADAHFGNLILEEIDDFIGSARPADLISGNASEAANAIIMARSANTRYRKAEMIEEAITKAQRRTESTGSGGNINNALRQNIRAILDNPKKRRSFNAQELRSMEELVRQGRTENFLRLVGKLSPSGNGLMAALGIGGTMINPAIGLASLAGAGAKALADRGTVNRATQLQNQVARGAPMPRPPMPLPPAALAYAQGANQLENKPLEIVIRGGAR
jgi:hypothetical protein